MTGRNAGSRASTFIHSRGITRPVFAALYPALRVIGFTLVPFTSPLSASAIASRGPWWCADTGGRQRMMNGQTAA